MLRSFIVTRVLTFLLALIVAGAPVLPAFAFAPEVGDGNALHASHGGTADMSKHAAPKQTSCAQHDSCQGQCCASCAHCFNAMFLPHPAFFRSHPAQTPILTALHPRDLVALPDRPPRFLFL